MRTLLFVTACMVAMAGLPGVVADHGTIASGTILVGSPHTIVDKSLAERHGVFDGVDGFEFSVPSTLQGETVQALGSATGPYDLDFWFYDATGQPVDAPGCSSGQDDQVCVVPSGAVTGFVTAHHGVNISVDVVHL